MKKFMKIKTRSELGMNERGRAMRRAVAIVLAHMVLLGCVFGSEGQKTPKELAVVAYSVRVPVGDEFSERVFGLWLRELKDKNPVTLAGDYHKLVDAQYPLAETAFELSNESQPEANAAKVVIAGHVTPREEGAYRIDFTELGRPPIYSGTTGLTIRPKERRVLRLPVVELGNGDKLETVVLLWYTTSDESGEKSSLEIE
jgi:hypothetical protein